MQDAANLCRTLQKYFADDNNEGGGKKETFQEAMAGYEKEVVQRGHEAVVSSGQNSLMLHEWEQLMDSAIFKLGAKEDGEK